MNDDDCAADRIRFVRETRAMMANPDATREIVNAYGSSVMAVPSYTGDSTIVVLSPTDPLELERKEVWPS